MGVGESGCICVKPFVTSKGTYYAFSDWLSYTCVCVTVYTVIHTRVCVCMTVYTAPLVDALIKHG